MTASSAHRYRVALSREGVHAVLGDGSKPALVGGPPPELGGDPHWWSPEHLLLSAVSLCFMTTFQALAARKGLVPMAYSSEASGVLDRTPEGLGFTSIGLEVTLKVAPGQGKLADRLLDNAKAHCVVFGALKVAVDLSRSIKEVEMLSPAHSP